MYLAMEEELWQWLSEEFFGFLQKLELKPPPILFQNPNPLANQFLIFKKRIINSSFDGGKDRSTCNSGCNGACYQNLIENRIFDSGRIF